MRNARACFAAGAALLLTACSSMPAMSGAPDYTGYGEWVARQNEDAAQSADVFYIHPTTFRSKTEYNMAMDDAETRGWTDRSVGARQLNAFADCCRLFMPFYRQASSLAFSDRDGRGDDAYELAYGDVVRAFREYLEHDNNGRPFIIAGHSQGALLGLRLLQREIGGTELSDRLVAAYLPGIGMAEGALPGDVVPCTTPKQTGCLASWNGFLEGRDTAVWKTDAARYAIEGRSSRIVCVNPLTFDATLPAADQRESTGMLPVATNDEAPLAPLRPHAVSARCDDGVLRVTLSDGVTADPLPNGSMHMHDIALFWANIRDNAVLRARSWQKDHAR